MISIKNIKSVISFFIIGFVFAGCSSQSSLVKENSVLAQKVDDVEKCKTYTCVCEVSTAIQSRLARQGKRMLQIYLIRHAKPDVKKKFLYSEVEVQQYYHNYDSASIIKIDTSMVHIELTPRHVIYCSNMIRSQETALELFGKSYTIVADTVFREFESKPIRIKSLVKFPLHIWQFFNRGTWLLGFNHRGIESYREAKQRAKQAAENLQKVAEREETAILVAHGMINGSIERALKKDGWLRVQKKGQINLGATVLVKIVKM